MRRLEAGAGMACMRRVASVAAACLVLAACQTEYRYEPFLANAENFEVANAKCQMLSTSAERQIVAWGSPMYVATANAANSLENAGRVDRFLQHCMTTQGWRRVAIAPKPSARAARTSTEIPPEMREKAVMLLSIEHFVRPCGIKLTSEARTNFRDLRESSPEDIRREADALGPKMYNRRVQEVGRKTACETTSKILKERGMI